MRNSWIPLWLLLISGSLGGWSSFIPVLLFLHRTGMDDLLGGMEHYYDPNDYNRVIYHSKSEDASDRIKQILADADKLLAECEGACDESSAYQLLVRVLKEQTVVEESGARRLKTKEDGAMGSQILQNPSDPDATYRENQGNKTAVIQQML